MKYAITFSQTITHKIVVDCWSFGDAEKIACDMIDTGEVDFTKSDIANATGEIDFTVERRKTHRRIAQ